jgi:mRNA degradation ribonuclease J1/J2
MHFVLEGGVHEIGGNKLFIICKKERIGIDFGRSFSVEKKFYSRPLLRPPNWNPLPVLVDIGYLPNPKKYPGLYRSDLMEIAQNELGNASKEPFLSHLFISHAHSDHYASAAYLHELTNIWLGRKTKDILEAYEEMSSKISIESEFLRYKKMATNEEIKSLKEKIAEIFRKNNFDFNDEVFERIMEGDEEIRKIINKEIKKDDFVKEVFEKIKNGVIGVVSSVLKKRNIENKELLKKIISSFVVNLERMIFGSFGSDEICSKIKEEKEKLSSGERKINLFEDEKIVKLEEFEVLPLRVSHQVVDSYAFIINSNGKKIGYISDFRWHGDEAEKTTKCIERMKKEKIDYLFIEFTRAHEDYEPTKEQVVDREIKAINRSKGLAIVDVPLSNNWELNLQYQIAKLTGRYLCISPKFAKILLAINGEYGFPKIDDEKILIVKDKNSEGAYEPDRKWEEFFFNSENTITTEEIHKNQENIIYIGGYFDINRIFSEIKPNPGSIYIRPFRTYEEESLEEEDVLPEIEAERLASLVRMEQWLRVYNLFWETKMPYVSGHATSSDVIRAVKEINPKNVIPIHTEHPKYFASLLRDTNINVIIPEKGKEYEIR